MSKRSKKPSGSNQDSSTTRNPAWPRLVAVIVVLSAVVFGYLYCDYSSTVGDDVQRTFVGRASCIECHQQQADLFQGSHHDKAMDLATTETVLGAFDGTKIEHFGITSTVFKDGDRFMVNTEGPDGDMHDYEVKYVFGVEPLQQYMVEMNPRSDSKSADLKNADSEYTSTLTQVSRVDSIDPVGIGQVQVLRITWDTVQKRWFYLKPPDVDEKIEPGDPLHWTGVTQCWNSNCAECHSTDLKKNFDAQTGTYHTTFSEIDVSCESCHGPASLHVKLAQNKGIYWDKIHGMGLAKLKTESNLPQIETCARCHSRRSATCNGFQAGNRFDDFYSCQLLSDRIYHDDGQILEEDYVYGSFIQSKMFHKGIRCSDCHDPHSAKLIHDNNHVCTSCHQHPAGKYDSPSHHHHEPGTPGAACVNCHMPATTYMAVDSRRDHSFRVPRVDLSVKFGTPNACTGCHLDQNRLAAADQVGLTQYLDWIIRSKAGDSNIEAELKRVDELMLAAVEEWYPSESSPAKSKYYADLVVGKSDSVDAVPTLVRLVGDSTAPAIFRATALEQLSDQSTPETLEAALKSIKASDPLVIAAALGRIANEVSRLLEFARYDNGRQSFYHQQLEPLLKSTVELTSHESRLVRVSSARIVAIFPADFRGTVCLPDERRAFDLAIQEFKDSLMVENDRATNHMQLGGMYELLGSQDRAIAAYRTAIRIEPELSGPRTNLASLLDAMATQMSRQMQRAQSSTTAANLQSTIAQIRKLQTEAFALRSRENELLKTDLYRSRDLPNTHSLHYRYALSCYLQRDYELTEKHMLAAYEQQPDSPIYILVLATYYRERNELNQAVTFVNRLVKLEPDHPGYKNLAIEISKEVERQKSSPQDNELGQ